MTSEGAAPALGGGRRPRTGRPRRAPISWQGSGCVLVIDDEPGVRRVAQRIFEKCGLTVLLAATGREGLELLATGQRVDSVLLDLTMPEMDGAQTFRAIRAQRPELPIVICSGYSRDEVRKQLDGETALQLVEKPFTPDTLVDAIRATIEGPELQSELE